jgi:hypothetical protein
MPGPDDTDEVLSATLIQIAGHAERISNLDTREDAHYRDISARLATTLARLDRTEDALASVTAPLIDQDAHDHDDQGTRYEPIPAARWWRLTGADREAAISRLRAWVEQIYQPGYGRLAVTLPPCWEQHTPCLYVLDWLSELWSVLYLAPQRDNRTIAAQAEWHTRLLPAAAEQMAFEATGCHHSAALARRQPSTGSFHPNGGYRASR